MATAAQVIAVAQSQAGVEETGGPSGHDGNITPYWAELDPADQGQPWCAAFQVWVDKHAAAPAIPVSTPYYCPTYVTYAKVHGLWSESGRYSEGDLVFYDFEGVGYATHVERIVSDDGTTMTTIGGNTLPDGVTGDQANGGGVYLRHRPHGPEVLGVLQYSRLLSSAPTPVPVPAPRGKTNPFAGSVSAAALESNPVRSGEGMPPAAPSDRVRFVQWAIGVPVDGRDGPQTTSALQSFQRYHGLTPDGVAGPLTYAALDKVTH